MEKNQLQAQGLIDAFKLFDKDLIEKALAISKTLKIEQLDDGKVTRITIDLVNHQK